MGFSAPLLFSGCSGSPREKARTEVHCGPDFVANASPQLQRVNFVDNLSCCAQGGKGEGVGGFKYLITCTGCSL